MTAPSKPPRRVDVSYFPLRSFPRGPRGTASESSTASILDEIRALVHGVYGETLSEFEVCSTSATGRIFDGDGREIGTICAAVSDDDFANLRALRGEVAVMLRRHCEEMAAECARMTKLLGNDRSPSSPASPVVDPRNQPAELDVGARRLRSWRKERGITQSQLARLCGIEQGVLSKYENGYRSMSPKARKALAAALDVSDAWLCGKTDDPTPTAPKGKP